MAIDTTKIGEVAASLMEDLPEEADGEIVAVGIVVVVDTKDDGGSYTRIKTTHDIFYEQLGLFHAAIRVAESGIPWEGDE